MIWIWIPENISFMLTKSYCLMLGRSTQFSTYFRTSPVPSGAPLSSGSCEPGASPLAGWLSPPPWWVAQTKMVNYYCWKPSNLQNILPAGSTAGPPPAFSSSEQSGSGNSSCWCCWGVVPSVKVRDRLTSCSRLHPYKAMWGQSGQPARWGYQGSRSSVQKFLEFPDYTQLARNTSTRDQWQWETQKLAAIRRTDDDTERYTELAGN